MASDFESRIDGVPHFEVTVTEKNLDGTAKTLLRHIKKSWDVNLLHRKDFNEGITNRLVGYYLKAIKESTARMIERGRSDIVLFRIYGIKTDLIINRAQELRNIEELSRCNLAPPVYCTFENGYCYKFIEGEVCTPQDFTNKEIMRHSAVCMAKLHTVQLSENYLKYHQLESTVFKTISHYINLIPQPFKTAELQTRFEKNVPSHRELHAEVKIMQEAVGKLRNMAITFCHNDLLIANLIFDQDEGKMHCIDHEYGTPNYSAYDIGNHFNEFAGVDTVDYNLFPNKETQLWWLRIYLQEIKELKGSEAPVTDEDVKELYVHVDHMSLVSHLFWGVWAQIQADNSLIDFDFMGYGITRLNEYFKRKTDVLNT